MSVLSAAGLVGCQHTGAHTGPCTGPCASSCAKKKSSVRVGTFRRADLMVAYYASDIHDREMQALRAARDEAKARGDTAEVARLEAQGAAGQELAHRQLAGQAGLDNILGHLEEAMPDIAKEAGVDAIVEQPRQGDVKVETVDVTERLVKRFKPARADARGSQGGEARNQGQGQR